MSKYAATGVLVALLFGVYTFIYRAPAFPLDDAYITLHNATILAGAKEISYAGAPALTGTTSVFHTALVAALSLLLPPVWALMAVTWLGILFYSWAVIYLASVYKLSRWTTAVVLLVALFAGESTFQLLNGLETGLAMAALILTFALASRTQPSRYLCILCGILPFLRPELVVVSGLVLVYHLWLRVRSGARQREIMLDLVAAFSAALIFLIILLADTGHLYPQTINAKRFFFAEASEIPVYKLLVVYGALQKFAIAVGLSLVACLAFAFFTAIGRIALAFVGIFLAAYYAQFPGALWHNDQRYLYLLVPIMLLGVAIGVSAPQKRVRLCATTFLVLSALQAVIMLPSNWSAYERGRRMATVESAWVASFCNQHFQPGSRILLHDAGYLSYATRFPLIDMVGLKTPSSVRIHRQLTYATGGKQRAEAINEIALLSHPDYLIVIGDWERIFGIAAGLHANGWDLEPVRPVPPVDGLDHYMIFRMTRKSLSMQLPVGSRLNQE